jgi:beta-glucosidase
MERSSTPKFLRASALALLAVAAACGSSSSSNDSSVPSGIDGFDPWGGQGGNAGLDGGAGTGGATIPPSVDGGAWVPSATCQERAATILAILTPAQMFGQMTQVDSNGLTVSEATSAMLGSVFSGGGSDPTTGNKATDWVKLVSSYLDIAKGGNPHMGLLYGIDAVHGNNNVQDATMFPHAIGLGATRNPTLVEQVGRITALEMLGVGENWDFTPTVAPTQDIRWGRTFETFGEKIELTSQLGLAMVNGLQNRKLGSAGSVLASAKHYAGDGATDGGKNTGDVTKVDESTFRAIAIEPYRASIAGGVGSIMVSYSRYQGVQMTASKKWLTEVLKGELGFQGLLVSDWDAVGQLEVSGGWREQVKIAVNAGLDMFMLSHGTGSQVHRASELASTLTTLVNMGEIPADRIRDAVRRILTVKCEMGLLDGDTTIDPALTAAIGSPEHRAVARDAVRQSMVLLKNDGILPLSKTTLTKIHVTGSGADSLAKQCGGWTVGWQGLGGGTSTGSTAGTTVLASVKKLFAGTSTTVTSSTDGSGAAGASAAIVVVGESPYAEGQGDSSTVTLTAADFSTIAKVKAANVPFVVVLFSGRPLILTDSKSGVSALDQSNALVAAFLPGTEGDGITDVLFGDYNPTGKLSFTWPASLSQIPIHDGDGQVPLFKFGDGLTYR